MPPEIGSQDVIIQGPETHDIPGLINLFGIESPGLTASLSLADMSVTGPAWSKLTLAANAEYFFRSFVAFILVARKSTRSPLQQGPV